MWPKIRAIPGLRLVHRWGQGHICAKTDTGYFKIIVGLLKDDFDAWEKAGFEPEHEYMTHMSKSALIDMVRCGVPFRLLCVVDRFFFAARRPDLHVPPALRLRARVRGQVQHGARPRRRFAARAAAPSVVRTLAML